MSFLRAFLNVFGYGSAITRAEIAMGTFECSFFFVRHKMLVETGHSSSPKTTVRTLVNEAFDKFDSPNAAAGIFTFPFHLRTQMKQLSMTFIV